MERLDDYSIKIIKLYERDLCELNGQKKKLKTELSDIERQMIERRMLIKQIKGEC